MRGATRAVWVVGALALVVVSLETGLRLGGSSPDTRFTLPRYSLGYFWDTPLGWTSVVGGVPVNRDSLQFSSLAGFLRDEPTVVVPPGDNVYVRFAGYALVGSVLLFSSRFARPGRGFNHSLFLVEQSSPSCGERVRRS